MKFYKGFVLMCALGLNALGHSDAFECEMLFYDYLALDQMKREEAARAAEKEKKAEAEKTDKVNKEEG